MTELIEAQQGISQKKLERTQWSVNRLSLGWDKEGPILELDAVLESLSPESVNSRCRPLGTKV